MAGRGGLNVGWLDAGFGGVAFYGKLETSTNKSSFDMQELNRAVNRAMRVDEDGPVLNLVVRRGN